MPLIIVASELFAMLFAQIGPLFTEHWHIVALIAALFFVTQIFLCVKFIRRTTKQCRMLDFLQSDLDKGGNGRIASETTVVPFAWAEWVIKIFPGGDEIPGNYARDDVLQELDARISSSSDYLLLQRLGVAAPLLGVILTVLGFFWMEIPENAESLDSILFAVVPLVLGVGAGAALAFINQILLHFAGSRAEALRMAARNWFDTAVWSSVGLDSQAATIKAIHAIEKMADSISNSVAQQTKSTEQLVETTTSFQEAGAVLHDAVASFGKEMKDIPGSLSQLHDTTSVMAEALTKLIPVGERAVAGLDVSVSAFRTAVENDFVEAASLHRQVVEQVKESVERLGESSEHLRGGSEDLSGIVKAQHESFEAMNETIQSRVLPAHETLHTTIEGLSKQMSEFCVLMKALSQNVNNVAVEFDGVAGKLEPSVSAFSAAVNGQFTAAASQHEAMSKTLSESVQKIHDSVGQLTTGARLLGTVVSEHAELSKRIGPAHDIMQKAVENMGSAGEALQNTMNDVGPTQTNLREASDSFSNSAIQLATFVETLGPAATQLGRLDETLLRMKGTVDAMQDFSKLDVDVEQLAGMLAQAAMVAEAISDLPNQIRDILEDLVATHSDGQTKAPLIGWLRGRPEKTVSK
jgi:methyl-accepting chemotaxis protein